MTPTERRTALIRLLAHLDQQIAEAESLASQPVLAYDEVEYVAIHLEYRRTARRQAERLLRKLDSE